MKKMLSVSFIVLLIIGLFMFGKRVITTTAFAATITASEPGKHEHHRELDRAVERLKEAKMDLEKVRYELGGHRVKAIEAVDQALEEVHHALSFYTK